MCAARHFQRMRRSRCTNSDVAVAIDGYAIHGPGTDSQSTRPVVHYVTRFTVRLRDQQSGQITITVMNLKVIW